MFEKWLKRTNALAACNKYLFIDFDPAKNKAHKVATVKNIMSNNLYLGQFIHVWIKTTQNGAIPRSKCEQMLLNVIILCDNDGNSRSTAHCYLGSALQIDCKLLYSYAFLKRQI